MLFWFSNTYWIVVAYERETDNQTVNNFSKPQINDTILISTMIHICLINKIIKMFPVWCGWCHKYSTTDFMIIWKKLWHWIGVWPWQHSTAHFIGINRPISLVGNICSNSRITSTHVSFRGIEIHFTISRLMWCYVCSICIKYLIVSGINIRCHGNHMRNIFFEKIIFVPSRVYISIYRM